jgi:hypothetical protein
MGVDEVEDAVPLSWYVRVQFDELLNPDIEELIPIADSDLFQGSLAKTQPVVLSCGGVNVAYDGYWNPSGNNITFPLGPSLYIAPTADAITTIPTGSDCALMLKADVIVDKDGEHVPAAQVGPYPFKIAPMLLLSADPAPPRDAAKPTPVAPEDPVVLTFNAQVDVASLDAALVTITEVTSCTDTAGIPHTAVIKAVSKDPTSVAISILDAPSADVAFDQKKTYVITFAAGAQVTQDITPGGVVDLTTASVVKKPICFLTNSFAPAE